MIKPNKYLYPMTLSVIAITSIVTILQFIFPEILDLFRRNPSDLASGQWWRIVTPLLVHSDGWWQYLFNIACIGAIGIEVERLCGKVTFLILYLAGGLAGEIAGYISWDPYGAGASVGFCGLLGGLSVVMIGKSRAVPSYIAMLILYIVAGLVGFSSGIIYVSITLFIGVAILFTILSKRNKPQLLRAISGSSGLLGGVILLLLHDIHGAAIVAGGCIAFILQGFHNMLKEG